MKPSGHPERIFHTGRNAWIVTLMIFGVVCLVGPWIILGLILLCAGPQTARIALDIGSGFFALSAAVGAPVLVITLPTFLRQAIGLHSEGVLVTTWLGRQTFVVWQDLDAIILGDYAVIPYAGDFTVSWLEFTLVVKRPEGGTKPMVVSRLGSKVGYREIAAALAERADLEYVAENQHGLDPGETAWRKRSAPGESPRQVAGTERAPSGATGAPFPPAVPGPAPIGQEARALGVATPHGEPERVFPTARNTATELLICGPLVVAILGFALGWLARGGELTAIGGIARVNVTTIVGYYAALVAGLVGFGALLAYVRSALVVYWEGLLLRGWSGRGRFVPWSDLEGIIADYTDAPNEGVTLYLVLRRGDGATERIPISSASSWGPIYEGITSTLAQRANLEYLGRKEGQEVWRRKKNDSIGHATDERRPHEKHSPIDDR